MSEGTGESRGPAVASNAPSGGSDRASEGRNARPTPHDPTESAPTFVTLKNGMRIRYVHQGPSIGPGVILLHGYSDSSFSFSRVMPLLPSTMRVVAIDQRGHGRSSRASDYSMDALARDVIELMDALAIPGATLVGHSMGSFVARRAAVLAPTRVTRLVLLGAGIRFRTAATEDLQKAVAALTDPVDSTFVREFQYSTVAMPMPEAFMNTVIAESHCLDAATWKAVLNGQFGYEATEAAIHVPTLVLGGDEDSVFPVGEQRATAHAVRGARAVIVPGVGHTLHWEVPSRFVDELLSFLQ